MTSAIARFIQNARFTPVRLREGYDMREVDDLLDLLVTTVVAGGDVRTIISAATFTTVRLREGYDIVEVDEFLAAMMAWARDPEGSFPAEPAGAGGSGRGWWSRILGRSDR